MDDDDAALLAAVCDGSELAFNQLIDRHQQAVRTFLRGVTARLDDADDIAQETFLALWTHGRSFGGRGTVRAWLFSIAWRKAKDFDRRWFRRRARDTTYHEMAPSIQSPAMPAEERLALHQALASLSLDQRAAVMLCLGCGFSDAEAADALDAPLGTIKSSIFRGRARLRAALGERS